MNLETQIELITVPQEFTRLCNAVLAAEFGDDFLPIDDDRPDRGNDGYQKSAKRLFAVHCFKRAQNQSLDQAIRRKMFGDLGKAIALKSENRWEIEGWTFISNYPIDEETGRRAVGMGREAGIDVSWKGPNFLARVLHEHKILRSQFPALQVTEIGERLDELKDAVADGSGASESSAKPPNCVPRTEDEKRELLITRPPSWEYLLFAYVLRRGKEHLEMKWHDHNMPPFRRSFAIPDVAEASTYLDREIDNLLSLTGAMMAVISKEAQEQTFGAPGEPGDPFRIEHMAGRTSRPMRESWIGRREYEVWTRPKSCEVRLKSRRTWRTGRLRYFATSWTEQYARLTLCPSGFGMWRRTANWLSFRSN